MWNPFAYFNLPQGFLTHFLKSQFTPLPLPRADLSGQTIVVTGANTGLGLEAARHCVRLNARTVILACRSIEKGKAAQRAIEESLPLSKNVVEVWGLDLSSYQSVKEFCQRAEKLPRLDAVLENAGLATPVYEEFEGMESTITVNVISTFLLALLLLPKLRADGLKYNMIPRITVVSSEAHEQAKFQECFEPSLFNAFKNPKYIPDRYNVSKLLEVLAIRELAPAMTASGKPKVIFNTLTPGFCHSDLMRNATFPLNLLAWVGKMLIGRTTEMGSRTLVAAVTAGEESHGCYMVDCNVHEVGAWVRSNEGREAQRRFYAELVEVLEGIEKGITGNI